MSKGARFTRVSVDTAFSDDPTFQDRRSTGTVVPARGNLGCPLRNGKRLDSVVGLRSRVRGRRGNCRVVLVEVGDRPEPETGE